MSNLQTLYENHHKKKRGADFVFGNRSRTDPIQNYLMSTPLANGHIEKSILDLGCRDCAFAQSILHRFHGYKYTGVEIDRTAIRSALGKGFSVVECEITEFLAKDNNKYNLILLSEVLEHMPDPVLTLGLIRERLATGGLCFVSVPNAYRLKNRLKFLFNICFEDDYTHLRWFNKALLTEYTAEVGLRIKHFDYINSRFLWISKTLFANTMFMVVENN